MLGMHQNPSMAYGGRGAFTARLARAIGEGKGVTSMGRQASPTGFTHFQVGSDGLRALTAAWGAVYGA